MSASENEFLARNSSIVQALRTYFANQPGGIEKLLPKEKHSIDIGIQPVDSDVVEDKGKNTPHLNNDTVRLALLEILKEERKFLGFLEDLQKILNDKNIRALFSEDAQAFIDMFSEELNVLIPEQKQYLSKLNECVEKGFNRKEWIECINNRDIGFIRKSINFNVNLLFLEKLFSKVDRDRLHQAIDMDELDRMAYKCAFDQAFQPVKNYFQTRVNMHQIENSINLLESRKLDLSGAEQIAKEEIEQKKQGYINSLEKVKQTLDENKAKVIGKLKELDIYFGDDSASMERSYLSFEQKRDVSQGTPAFVLKGLFSQIGVQYVTRKSDTFKRCKELFLGDSPEDREAQAELRTAFNTVEMGIFPFNQYVKDHEISEKLELKFNGKHEDAFANLLLDERVVASIARHLISKKKDPRKPVFNMKLLALVWRAIKSCVFADPNETKNFIDLLIAQAAKFSLRRELSELLNKADEYEYDEADNIREILKVLNKESTEDMVEILLALVRNALIELEPDMADFFLSGKLRIKPHAKKLQEIVNHYREESHLRRESLKTGSAPESMSSSLASSSSSSSGFETSSGEEEKEEEGLRYSKSLTLLSSSNREAASRRAPAPLPPNKRVSVVLPAEEPVVNKELGLSERGLSSNSKSTPSLSFSSVKPSIRDEVLRRAPAPLPPKSVALSSSSSSGAAEQNLSVAGPESKKIRKLRENIFITKKAGFFEQKEINVPVFKELCNVYRNFNGFYNLAVAARDGERGVPKDLVAAYYLARLAEKYTQTVTDPDRAGVVIAKLIKTLKSPGSEEKCNPYFLQTLEFDPKAHFDCMKAINSEKSKGLSI